MQPYVNSILREFEPYVNTDMKVGEPKTTKWTFEVWAKTSDTCDEPSAQWSAVIAGFDSNVQNLNFWFENLDPKNWI